MSINFQLSSDSRLSQADVPSAPPEAHQPADLKLARQVALIDELPINTDWRREEIEACRRVRCVDPSLEIDLTSADQVSDEMTFDNTLILMACGGTKRQLAPGKETSLIDLYEGPMWQTLKTHLGDWYYRIAEVGFTPAHVVVLSGKYGIADAALNSQTYEARLTKEKADMLIRAGILEHQDRFGTMNTKYGADSTPLSVLARSMYPKNDCKGAGWRGVIVCGGSEYRRVFMALLRQLVDYGAVEMDAPILTTAGGIGEQRSQLGSWLQSLRMNTGPCKKPAWLDDAE